MKALDEKLAKLAHAQDESSSSAAAVPLPHTSS